MNEQYVKEKIRQIAKDQLDADLQDGEIKENGIDSIGLVTLIFNIEDEFGIMFSDDDLQPEKLVTTEDLVEITMKHL